MEILEIKKCVVAMNATEAKTTKIKILDEQVVTAAETITGHMDGAAAGKANSTEGTPRGWGGWGA